MSDKLLFTGSEWTFEKLDATWKVIDDIGANQLKLDYYEPQIEIISSDQMIDNYSQHALPIMYSHWSYGKSFMQTQNDYKKGRQGLAYEVVINTNPCIAYLMETNTMTMQALVMAHAVCGHGGFFKTNYLFRDWSDADSILDYMKFARNYIADCEQKYGEQEVEELLDACHSLQLHGVHKYKKAKKRKAEHKAQDISRLKYEEETFDDMWRTLPKQEAKQKRTEFENKALPEENILYFIEKYSPVLKPWQREVVRIVRKIAQYFYPQRQTQLMNEGHATQIHYTILNMMYDQGYLGAGSVIEFLKSHAGVITQRDFDHKHYSGINVYALGFAMMEDIKRICISPDEEDKRLFPQICNTNWVETVKHIVSNYRDESFIMQFLSPKIIKRFKLFTVHDDEEKNYQEILHTQDEEYVHQIRKVLAAQYDLSKRVPHLEITDVDWEGTRRLSLVHYAADGVRLNHDDAKKTALYLHILWGHEVSIQWGDEN